MDDTRRSDREAYCKSTQVVSVSAGWADATVSGPDEMPGVWHLDSRTCLRTLKGQSEGVQSINRTGNVAGAWK